jgi:hypothetical protein
VAFGAQSGTHNNKKLTHSQYSTQQTYLYFFIFVKQQQKQQQKQEQYKTEQKSQKCVFYLILAEMNLLF